jgi:hypothetical protein
VNRYHALLLMLLLLIAVMLFACPVHADVVLSGFGLGLGLRRWRGAATGGGGGSPGQFAFNDNTQSGLIILLEDI